MVVHSIYYQQYIDHVGPDWLAVVEAYWRILYGLADIS